MRKASRERPDDGSPRIVPMFPLPNVFLFPGCVMPLHVFEPRYRQMIEDLLDGPGQIVMGTVPEEHADALAGAPPVRPIAGLGEICRHERLPDGRFLVWLFGLSRVKVEEQPSTRLSRRVKIQPLLETAPPKGREGLLRDRLRHAILARCDEATTLPTEIPISCLADLLLQRLSLRQREMERLYEMLDVEERAEGALEIHARRPHVPRPPRRKTAE